MHTDLEPEAEAGYRAVFDAPDAARLLVDPADGRIIDANGAAPAFYGYSRDDLLAMTVFQLGWAGLEEEGSAGWAGGREEVHRLADGSLRPVKVFGGSLAVRGRHLVFAAIHDLGPGRRAEEQLRLAARIFDTSAEGVIVTDVRGRILTVNQAFTRVTGYSQAEALGKTPALLKSGRQGEDFYRDMWACLESDGHWHGEIWNRRKDGGIYAEWLSISAVRDSKGEVANYVGMFSDLTQAKEAQRRIEFLATHDDLTGLPNRALFKDRLRLARARAERSGGCFALLFVDLDDFKAINDTLGHDCGDALLRQAAGRLKSFVRAEDTVARLGGDEFVVLLDAVTRDEAAGTARRIVQALAAGYELNGQACSVSASVGVSFYPDDAADADTLLRNADAAMYRAKAQGRNGYQFYSPEMAERASHRTYIETGLRRALERRQFALEYQPLLALESGELIGVEALLRWSLDGREMAPAEFISVAEESNLILDIDDWVLGELCRHLRAWDEAGLPPLPASMNLSARHFRQPDMVAHLAGIVTRAGLTPARICLEVSETALGDAERALPRLADLRQAGFALTIDDFGTGLSSLACLKRLPVDTLKIDRSFVHGLIHNQEDRAVVMATIALASSLGLTVVAEGVASGVQEAVLRRLGCHAAQGFRHTRPLPAERFLAWARRHGGRAGRGADWAGTKRKEPT